MTPSPSSPRATFPAFPSPVVYTAEAEQRLTAFDAYGGIVIRPEELELCKGLPGFVTDSQINRV